MDEAPKEILSDEDKAYIIANYNNMSPFQMAMRRNIKTDGTKCPVIADFISSSNILPNQTTPIPPPVVLEIVKNEEEKVEEIILAPETSLLVPVPDDLTLEGFVSVLRGLNISVREPPSEKDKKDMAFLINQMLSKRYILTQSSYKNPEYKDLFREEFIRALWGKGEMPQEEINDFLDVCGETVFQYDVRCKIKDLEKRKESIVKNEKDQRLKAAQLSGIDTIILEYNTAHVQSTKRTSEIKKSLGTNREQRLKDSRPQGLTILALVETFQNAEKREKMIEMQERADAKLKKTLLLLDEFDEMKALILGVSPDEILKGGL